MLLTSDSVTISDFAAQTGWAVKDHGACKAEHCVPLPPQARLADGSLSVPVLAERLGMPWVRDEQSGVSALGPESAVTGRMLSTAVAPELELPTFDGQMFRLSSLRGTRVLLVAWASWCGCAHDLPLWAALRERVRPLGVEIVTVALDTAGPEAGRVFVERAAPRHPALVDVSHSLGSLFGITNVPSGVWIDESGVIVRPAEPAFPGRVMIFEELAKADLARETAETGDTLTLTREVLRSGEDGLTDEVAERLELTRRIAAVAEPELYLQMLLDWAENGAASRYVLDPDEVVERSAPRSADSATATAHFELGQYFQNISDHDSAVRHWRLAHELAPDNWTYKRQAWRYEYADGGRPSRYDGSMEQDLRTLGPENYYPKLRP